MRPPMRSFFIYSQPAVHGGLVTQRLPPQRLSARRGPRLDLVEYFIARMASSAPTLPRTSPGGVGKAVQRPCEVTSSIPWHARAVRHLRRRNRRRQLQLGAAAPSRAAAVRAGADEVPAWLMYVNAIRYSVLWPSARGAATATPHGTGSPACDAPSGPAPCAARADAVSREVASWIMTVLDGASHLALRSVGEIDGALSASLQALADDHLTLEDASRFLGTLPDLRVVASRSHGGADSAPMATSTPDGHDLMVVFSHDAQESGSAGLPQRRYTITHDDFSGTRLVKVSEAHECHEGFYQAMMRDEVFGEWVQGPGGQELHLHVRVTTSEYGLGPTWEGLMTALGAPGPAAEKMLAKVFPLVDSSLLSCQVSYEQMPDGQMVVVPVDLPPPSRAVSVLPGLGTFSRARVLWRRAMKEMYNALSYLRLKIFADHMPEVVFGVVAGDRGTFLDRPELLLSPVIVHFHAHQDSLNRVQQWGPLLAVCRRVQRKHAASSAAQGSTARQLQEVWDDAYASLGALWVRTVAATEKVLALERSLAATVGQKGAYLPLLEASLLDETLESHLGYMVADEAKRIRDATCRVQCEAFEDAKLPPCDVPRPPRGPGGVLASVADACCGVCCDVIEADAALGSGLANAAVAAAGGADPLALHHLLASVMSVAVAFAEHDISWAVSNALGLAWTLGLSFLPPGITGSLPL